MGRGKVWNAMYFPYFVLRNEKSNVKIYNVLGKMVFEKNDYRVELIDISTWSNGIFVVHISNNSGKTVKKLVKK